LADPQAAAAPPAPGALRNLTDTAKYVGDVSLLVAQAVRNGRQRALCPNSDSGDHHDVTNADLP